MRFVNGWNYSNPFQITQTANCKEQVFETVTYCWFEGR